MQLSRHLIASACISALVWWWLRSSAAALACFLAGVFVDLDHLFDFLYYSRGRPRVRRFFRVFKFEILDNVFVFLHSWEIALAWLALMVYLPEARGPVSLGLFVGFATHLAFDNIFNGHSRWAYFLLYRVRHGFAGRYYYGVREYRRRLKRARRREQRKTATDGHR